MGYVHFFCIGAAMGTLLGCTPGVTRVSPEITRFEILDIPTGYTKTAAITVKGNDRRILNAEVEFNVEAATHRVPLYLVLEKVPDQYSGQSFLRGTEVLQTGVSTTAMLTVNYISSPPNEDPGTLVAKATFVPGPTVRIEADRFPSCMRVGDQIQISPRLTPAPQVDDVSLAIGFRGKRSCLRSFSRSADALVARATCPGVGRVQVSGINHPLIPNVDLGYITIRPSLAPPSEFKIEVGDYIDVGNPTEPGGPSPGVKTRAVNISWVSRSDARDVILFVIRASDGAVVEESLFPATKKDYTTALRAGEKFKIGLRSSFDGCFKPVDWSGDAIRDIEIPN
jgi:hypothetical protein